MSNARKELLSKAKKERPPFREQVQKCVPAYNRLRKSGFSSEEAIEWLVAHGALQGKDSAAAQGLRRYGSEGKNIGWVPLILWAVGISGAWAAYLWAVKHWVTSGSEGPFGDLFGGLNALFSGFAFAGLIYAILLQRTELSLQREELRATREAMETSANAQSQSEQTFRNELRIQRLTSQLQATTTLTHWKVQHIAMPGLHGSEFPCAQVESWDDGRIDRVLQQVLSRLKAHGRDPHLECLARDLAELQTLRRAMQKICTELNAEL